VGVWVGGSWDGDGWIGGCWCVRDLRWQWRSQSWMSMLLGEVPSKQCVNWGSSVALAEPNTPTWVGGCLECRRLAVQILRARDLLRCSADPPKQLTAYRSRHRRSGASIGAAVWPWRYPNSPTLGGRLSTWRRWLCGCRCVCAPRYQHRWLHSTNTPITVLPTELRGSGARPAGPSPLTPWAWPEALPHPSNHARFGAPSASVTAQMHEYTQCRPAVCVASTVGGCALLCPSPERGRR